jgi:hypothetical protein
MKTFRQKGINFEIEIAKTLSRWIGDSKRKYCLWRSLGSGSLATRAQNFEFVEQSGDICALSEKGREFTSRIYVECKRWKTLDNPFEIIDKNKSLKFIDVIQGAIENIGDQRKIPWIIIRRDYSSSALLFTLCRYVNRFYLSTSLKVQISQYEICVVSLEELINKITWESYKKFLDEMLQDYI